MKIVRGIVSYSVVFLVLIALYASPAASADGDIFITFLARPAAPISEGTLGHAFFCIAYTLSHTVKESCYGFYPKNQFKVFDGPGMLSDEFTKDAMGHVSVSLQHRITQDSIRGIYDVLESFAGQGYKILVNNCADLLLAVAKRAGLRAPDRKTSVLPTEVVEGLKKLYWQGQWQSNDTQARFRLDIHMNSLDWSERNDNGVLLKVTVPFSPREGHKIRIERLIDASILAYLGYHPSLSAQIMGRGLKPSFLVMERVDQRIEAQWYELLVTMDTKANLHVLKQPGTSPAQPFTFDPMIPGGR